MFFFVSFLSFFLSLFFLVLSLVPLYLSCIVFSFSLSCLNFFYFYLFSVALSISGEGCGRSQFIPSLFSGFRLLTLAEGKKSLLKKGDAGLLLLISPCQEVQYNEGKRLGELLQVHVIFLF